MPEGVIFDIQRFSVHDGPGIRTTVFFKGCPLSCKWCHNPEGLCREPKIRYFAEKCIGCNKCALISGKPPYRLAGADVDETAASAVNACPAAALAVCGKKYSAEGLFEQICRDKDFYGDRGGVTFSGGEPTAQPKFLEEMLTICRENKINTAVDTCGYAQSAVFEKISGLCDLLLFDIKGIDPQGHRHYTGRDNGIIHENFKIAAKSGTPIWVRVPLIAGYTDSVQAAKDIAHFLLPYKSAVQRVTLIPYHSFGNAKYKTLGLDACAFPEVNENTAEKLKKVFAEYGFDVQN